MLKHLADPRHMSCSITSAGTLRLPAGRLSYPNLLTPRAMPGESEDSAKYSTSIMLPDKVDMALALKAVNDLAVSKWGPDKLAKVRKPFLRHAEKADDKELTDNFPILIRLSSGPANPPTVMFANGERCSTPQEIYAGRWAVITVRPFTWSHPTGGNGVSFGLSNVLLLDHDDPIGSVRANAEAEFADLFVAADSAAAKVVAAGNGTGTFGDRGATRNPDSLFD